ncbi:PREDICTED: zinc finger protein 664-like [Papilio xuthus]|uniref:Zinc finger protein 664-like n=1 Tax=Papilio xuthus TaxID=66420 RepID=A0AAJ7EG64_PAPXU|nr:PREDICTED: zinc finger protein 664-like [Papilio xuthus]
MEEGVTYCILCAQIKCFSKLINLHTDGMLNKTAIKLSRLNISYDALDGEKLPRMICISCMEKLDKAFEFVSEVDKALIMLKELYENKIKTEDTSIENQEINELDSISEYSVHIKPEDTQFSDSEASCDSLGKKRETSSERSLGDPVEKKSEISSLELTWNDYIWTCAYCETQFATLGELQTHSMQYHQCCNAYKCYDCKIWKMNLKQFIIHVKSHKKYLKVVCHKCNKKFMFACHVHMHMKTAHATKSPFVCLGCDVDFQNQEELSNHSQAFYKNKRRKFIPLRIKSNTNNLYCITCKKSYKTKGTLHAHLLTHTDRKREHICEKCGKGFLRKRDLAEHTSIHDERIHQCKVCQMKFKTLRILKQHESIHSAEKPFKCNECGREFRLKNQLTTHSIIHTDSRPHECTYCDKKFRFRSVLHLHLRQHTGEKPYSCDICVRKFTNWPNYNVHMKRMHKINMAKKKIPENGSPNNQLTSKITKAIETSDILQ